MFIPAPKAACRAPVNTIACTPEARSATRFAKLAEVLRMQEVELPRPVGGDPDGAAAALCLDEPHVLLLPAAGTAARQPQHAARPGHRGRVGETRPPPQTWRVSMICQLAIQGQGSTTRLSRQDDGR
jgi:hypothetical protein